MVLKFVLPVLALSTIISAQDLHRRRKEQYVIRDLDIENTMEENQRDQLRQEVAQYWTRLLQGNSVDPLSIELASVDVFSIEPLSISTLEPFSIQTLEPFELSPAPTPAPSKSPTAKPTSSPTKTPTMMPSAAPTPLGIVTLDIDDDFKVECSGKMAGGKMGGGKMDNGVGTAAPSYVCSGKMDGGKMGGKMSPSSAPTGLVPLDDGNLTGKMYGGKMSGKMDGGKMSPTSAPSLLVDAADVAGKMYGGKMNGGKMGGLPPPKSSVLAPLDVDDDSSTTATGGKMYGGKMYGYPTTSPVPFATSSGKMYNGGKMDGGGKMYAGKMSPTSAPAIVPLDDDGVPSGKNGGKMARG